MAILGNENQNAPEKSGLLPYAAMIGAAGIILPLALLLITVLTAPKGFMIDWGASWNLCGVIVFFIGLASGCFWYSKKDG